MVLKVLHVIYDDPSNPWVGGGGAVRVRELYRHLAGRVDVTVATGNFPGAKNETVHGIRYLRLGARSPYAWSRLTFAFKANALLRRMRYDAAIFDFSGYSPVFLPRNRPAGVTVHHASSPTAKHRWGSVAAFGLRSVERTMLRRARHASATSRASQETIAMLAPRVAVDMVAAGVPDELFSLVRQPAGYLLYFGRLDVFHKGLDTLVEAVALLVRRWPQLEIRIAGRGTGAARIREMALERGVEKNIVILGSVTDEERNRLMTGAELQLMPSRFEGFGLAAAEAMAAGVPLVASSAGSLPEVVDPPAGGILVPPGDAAALAAAASELLDDHARREALSKSARESAKRFRWEQVAEKHLAFINRIAATAANPLTT